MTGNTGANFQSDGFFFEQNITSLLIIIVILGKKLPDENFRCAIEGLPGEVGETVRDFEGSFLSRMQQGRHFYQV